MVILFNIITINFHVQAINTGIKSQTFQSKVNILYANLMIMRNLNIQE